MAKRKAVNPPQDLTPGPSPKGEGKLQAYAVRGQWMGYEKWDCRSCAFDTLQRPVMVEHLVTVHGKYDLLEDPTLYALIEPAAVTSLNAEPGTGEAVAEGQANIQDVD